MSELYTCGFCKGTFEKLSPETWNEEDVKAEFERNFPGETYDPTALCCDNCYQVIMFFEQNGGAIAFFA